MRACLGVMVVSLPLARPPCGRKVGLVARDVSVCEILQTEIRMLHASRTKADLSMYQLENAFWEVIAYTWMAVLLGSGRGGEGRGGDGEGGGCVLMVFTLLLRAWMDMGRECKSSKALVDKAPTHSDGPMQVGAMGGRGQLK